MFTIIIPTFNNLEYLKITLNSLLKNSKYSHEIIVHINEGTDGSLKYVKENNFNFTYSKKNLGLCSSVNLAAKSAKKDYILYSHDDMYFCPDWDIFLLDEVQKISTDKFYLSASMIEKNSGHIQFDAGDTYENFNEEKLLSNLNNINYFDFQGTHWAPHLIKKNIWDKIGGFSTEFDPGIGSDPDLNMKLWKAGVRIFKGLSKFKVYHFSSITLRKKINLTVNNGNKTFLKKWKITPTFFVKHYLRGGKFHDNKIISQKYFGPICEPIKNLNYYKDLIKCKIKLLLS
jgi:glycosyltransferase involved in cell wall biosynthesis